MASTSVICKELVANRQAISIDMRSAEPTPTANACYGLYDTATFFGLPRLRSMQLQQLVQCVPASHLVYRNTT